jgi:hypothetical protein
MHIGTVCLSGGKMKIVMHESQQDARNAAISDCADDPFARFSMVTEGYLVIRKFGPPIYHKCKMHEYGADH